MSIAVGVWKNGAPRVSFPHLHLPIVAYQGDMPPIWCPRYNSYTLLITVVGNEVLPRTGFPYLYLPIVVACRGDAPSVWCPRYSHYSPLVAPIGNIVTGIGNEVLPG